MGINEDQISFSSWKDNLRFHYGRGKVLLCYNDEKNHHMLGDLHDDTVHAIWRGEAMRKLRAAHRAGNGARAYTACKLSFLPREKSHLSTDDVRTGNCFVAFQLRKTK